MSWGQGRRAEWLGRTGASTRGYLNLLFEPRPSPGVEPAVLAKRQQGGKDGEACDIAPPPVWREMDEPSAVG